MTGRIDAIIDGGEAAIGLESTVIDMTVEPPVVLRPGAVGIKELEKIIGKVRFGYKSGNTENDKEQFDKQAGQKSDTNTDTILLIQRSCLLKGKVRPFLKRLSNCLKTTGAEKKKSDSCSAKKLQIF